jgi:hypothetical protein
LTRNGSADASYHHHCQSYYYGCCWLPLQLLLVVSVITVVFAAADIVVNPCPPNNEEKYIFMHCCRDVYKFSTPHKSNNNMSNFIALTFFKALLLIFLHVHI